jgi:hypothetical protein
LTAHWRCAGEFGPALGQLPIMPSFVHNLSLRAAYSHSLQSVRSIKEPLPSIRNRGETEEMPTFRRPSLRRRCVHGRRGPRRRVAPNRGRGAAALTVYYALFVVTLMNGQRRCAGSIAAPSRRKPWPCSTPSRSAPSRLADRLLFQRNAGAGGRAAESVSGDYFSSSANSHTRASRQSRRTVSSDTFRTAADSAALRPPKKRNSTT